MILERPERRRHKRHELDCPLRVSCDGSTAKGRTLNLSDGGALAAVPAGAAPQPGTRLDVSLSLPRTTPNTRMIEEVTSPAEVVRRQDLPGTGGDGVALRFIEPLDLAIEV